MDSPNLLAAAVDCFWAVCLLHPRHSTFVVTWVLLSLFGCCIFLGSVYAVVCGTLSLVCNHLVDRMLCFGVRGLCWPFGLLSCLAAVLCMVLCYKPLFQLSLARCFSVWFLVLAALPRLCAYFGLCVDKGERL